MRTRTTRTLVTLAALLVALGCATAAPAHGDSDVACPVDPCDVALWRQLATIAANRAEQIEDHQARTQRPAPTPVPTPTTPAPAPTTGPTTPSPADPPTPPTLPVPSLVPTTPPDQAAGYWLARTQAGVARGTSLRASGSITASTPGQVIEGLAVTGRILVTADDVTIRNTRVTGTAATVFTVEVADGVTGTRVEHSHLAQHPTACRGAGIAGGARTTVTRTLITGCGDGVKAQHDSRYEYNRIEVAKPGGSGFHLDGFQSQGTSRYLIRNNWVDIPIARGGNIAVFVQTLNAGRHRPVAGVHIEGNYLNGGNHTVYVGDGKDGVGVGNIRDVTITDNTLGPDHRYGSHHLEGTVAWAGNRLLAALPDGDAQLT